MDKLKTTEERVEDIIKAFDLLLRFLIQNKVVSEYHTNQFDTLLATHKEIEDE